MTLFLDLRFLECEQDSDCTISVNSGTGGGVTLVRTGAGLGIKKLLQSPLLWII